MTPRKRALKVLRALGKVYPDPKTALDHSSPFELLVATVLSAQSTDAMHHHGVAPVVDPENLYSEAGAGKLSPRVTGALPRIYVPNLRSNSVSVIDPASLKVVVRFRVGVSPQHVVPSYDLETLWVTNNAEGRTDGSLTPSDPATGQPRRPIPVDDPYNT